MEKLNTTDEYQILDSGNLQKLEQIGHYRFIRPALNAFWPQSLSKTEWDKADGVFQRNSSGGGKWTWKTRLPEQWSVCFDSILFIIKPTNFGHIGFFPEQKDNWIWLRKVIKETKAENAINLFAYSGGSTLAMAQAGAKVCHVDAAKGMVDWAKNNYAQNSAIKTPVRWIVDDVNKFIQREINRNETYNGIVLDPPSFGRGPNGQLWKIESDIIPLLEKCRKILSPKPKFILMSLHSHGFSETTLKRLVRFVFGNKIETECGEMRITEKSSKEIEAGSYIRVTFK